MSVKTKVFRGEGDLMVDALISASRVKDSSSAQMPGFGRDLVPYFDPGAASWDESGVNTGGDAAPPNRHVPSLPPAPPLPPRL
jgi:hypothetical protein